MHTVLPAFSDTAIRSLMLNMYNTPDSNRNTRFGKWKSGDDQTGIDGSRIQNCKDLDLCKADTLSCDFPK